MQTINGNAITLTRGDTLKATVALQLDGEPYEPEKLNYGRYNWDLEVTHGDGTVDTVMLGTLTITGEVE
jgi:hypothetical protein